MFYSLFDFEYKKDFDSKKGRKKGEKYFMRDPDLYEIGINYMCFDKVVFVSWLLYALSQAAVILFLA